MKGMLTGKQVKRLCQQTTFTDQALTIGPDQDTPVNKGQDRQSDERTPC